MRNQNVGQPFTFLRTRTLNEGQPREHVDNSTSIEKRGQKIPQLRVLLWDSFLHFLLLYKDCGEKPGNQPSLPLTTPLGKSFDCLFMSIPGLIYFLLTFISQLFLQKDVGMQFVYAGPQFLIEDIHCNNVVMFDLCAIEYFL